jgi:hypothetical protein
MSNSVESLTRETLHIRSVALNMIPQGVVVADRDGTIVDANDASYVPRTTPGPTSLANTAASF